MTKKPQDTVTVAKITLVGTIVVAVISVIGNLVLGYWQFKQKPAEAKQPEMYQFSVRLQEFPFEKSPVELHKGDMVEVIVLGASSIVLDCGLGAITIMGVVSHPDQHLSVLPTANLCSLIGRVGSESNPYFPVGAFTKFIADLDGALYLGINDAPPANCAKQNCFSDNIGSISVQVVVTRK